MQGHAVFMQRAPASQCEAMLCSCSGCLPQNARPCCIHAAGACLTMQGHAVFMQRAPASQCKAIRSTPHPHSSNGNCMVKKEP